MTGAAKHITLGTGILVVCVLVLVFAFTPPSERPDDDLLLAGQEPQEQRRSPQTPSMQPLAPRSDDSRDDGSRQTESLSWEDLHGDGESETAASEQPAVPEQPQRGSDRVLTWDDIEALPGGDSLVVRPSTDDAAVHRETAQPVAPDDDDWEPAASAGSGDERPADEDRVAAAPQREQRHVVVEGETYQSISAQYYGTTRMWRRIQEANDADERSLRPDMVLIIPAIEDEVAAAPTVAARDDAPEGVDKGHAAAERRYTVQRGDSYYIIARDQLGDARRHREIAELNGVDPYELRPGMVITLPAARTAARESRRERPSAPVAAEGQVVHVVESGDILGDISARYYGTSRRWREIAEANNISDRDPLHVGQRLIIPGAASESSAPGPSAAGDARRRGGDGRWHVVERGDTLQVISRRYYGTTRRHAELAAANPELDPRRLMVGTRVWVPGVSADTADQPTSDEARQPSRPAPSGPSWD
ncbi:MAG: LysM peptidoglycan-binding domain-containing protein [Planctomycetota bacterium]|nr:MAG: LysM peptidoglycan-binding domain-containing protein [Planctomycetota bacterium]